MTDFEKQWAKCIESLVDEDDAIAERAMFCDECGHKLTRFNSQIAWVEGHDHKQKKVRVCLQCLPKLWERS